MTDRNRGKVILSGGRSGLTRRSRGLKLVIIIRPEQGKTRTSKSFEKIIIRGLLEQHIIRHRKV